MITRDMIKTGYEAGLVKLIISPHDDGVACAIGDNWFYFGGPTAEEFASVEDYKEAIPAADIVSEIFSVLDESFKGSPEFEDEYRYYESYLRERLPNLSHSREETDSVEKQLHDILVTVANWYGTYSEEGSQIKIDNGDEVFTYNSTREALQDWVFTMLEDNDTNWDAELRVLLTNGIKVDGICVLKHKNDQLYFMATVDHPLSNGKTLQLDAGTFYSPQAAYVSRLNAKILLRERVWGNLSLEDFQTMMEDLRAEGEGGKKPHLPASYLRQYVNVDVIAFLKEQMEGNTKHYKGDFDIDKGLIEKAAASNRKADKVLLWLSRPMGTQCVPEHDVFVRDSSAYITWQHYAGEADANYIAYAVDLTGKENGVIRGNVCKLDFKAHAAEVAKKAVVADHHIWTFEDGEAVHVPFGEGSYPLCARLVSEHGAMVDSVIIPHDEEHLASVLHAQAAYRALTPAIKQPLNNLIQRASGRAGTPTKEHAPEKER